MPKRYNTPHRSRVVKTRLSEDEYADFTARLAPYGISQSEFLRQAIRRTAIRINQGFFRGCQRVRDTFILFPRKRRSKCVQTPQIHPKEEPCQTTENTITSS